MKYVPGSHLKSGGIWNPAITSAIFSISPYVWHSDTGFKLSSYIFVSENYHSKKAAISSLIVKDQRGGAGMSCWCDLHVQPSDAEGP